MLRAVKDLHAVTLHALDGEIGKVSEIFFDDEHWTVRYVVVETGNWLFGRKVLISPLSFEPVKWEEDTLRVNLTREQIKKSPDVDTDKPVSRQWESEYYGYFNLPYYWGGSTRWGNYGYPGTMLAQPFGVAPALSQGADIQNPESSDAHLRSTKEMTGYGITAADGHIGHIADFLVDEENWKLRYLAVDTRDWWPEKRVLLPPEWINHVSWSDKSVTVDVTRIQVQGAPEWNSSQPMDPAVEKRLDDYYARHTPSANN